MDVLLDTHAAIWFFAGDERLSKPATEIIENLENTIYISIASVWELGIKISTGKLAYDGGIDRFTEAAHDSGFMLMPLEPEHIKMAIGLPFIHRDPFDRILVAQAMVENMAVLTLDANIVKYDVETLW